ncbi:FRG domain-containing protein [Neobacillus sp. PS2-9]|uniref:FRG domain-containing protein n=1 Tax=Neobacillus sp. PS2-9 TaxID=3070676 RepID=UPI0027E14F85|nr:FRG domain-containing protein [Neobacillus sp. PS2-9]WML57445.1 FRG domain-containing protein [Neobacillus sp. PS2-9]
MENQKRAYELVKRNILSHIEENNIKLFDLWYRGESKIYDSMPSTLYRQMNFNGELDERKLSYLTTFDNIHRYEKWIYDKFTDELKEKNMDLYQSITKNGWDIVFFMQHYGIPTRFIDWSEDLNTSLFFATEKAHLSEEDAVLWLFEPKKMNEILRGSYQLQHPEPDNTYGNFVNAYILGINQDLGAAISSISDSVGVYASNDIERMYSQYGHFVFIPKEFRDMRQYIQEIVSGDNKLQERILKKLIIPNNEARLINQYLESIGCNSSKYKLNETPLINNQGYTFTEFINHFQTRS